MSKVSVNIAGVEFKNPVITASGTCGFGREYDELFPLEKLGGIALKGMTIAPREGNPPPRIAECEGGILNSVGLQNPGVDYFIKNDLPWLAKRDVRLIANVAGASAADYCAVVEKLNGTAVDMIELNISCPNVKEGGVSFGTSPASVEKITREVRAHCKKPLMVKLTPNVADIASVAKAAQEAGADAVSLINTLTGMRIDIGTRRPVLHNNTGGLSGAAVFPVAVRMVWQAANAVKIPVVGLGGISCWQDAVEMFLAGASVIQVGTASFRDAYAPVKIAEGIEKYLDDNGIADVAELVGKVEVY